MSANSEMKTILDAVKQVLKDRGLSYRAVAENIDVSEQTVKRLFNGRGDVSLNRILKICDVVGIQFSDLMELVSRPSLESFTLSSEQEQYLLEHPDHQSYFRLLVEGMSPEDIESKKQISRTSTQTFLRDLEELGVIQRQPFDRCKLMHRGSWIFQAGSPLYKESMPKSFEKMVETFSNPTFKPTHGGLVSGSSKMTSETASKCEQELKALINESLQRGKRDRNIHSEHDLIDVEWVLGMIAPSKFQTEKEIRSSS